MSEFIPHESWTCTHGECCADERCERWTWRLCVVSVIAFVLAGLLIAEAVLS